MRRAAAEAVCWLTTTSTLRMMMKWEAARDDGAAAEVTAVRSVGSCDGGRSIRPSLSPAQPIPGPTAALPQLKTFEGGRSP